MMHVVNIHEAKTQLSKLLEEVKDGNEIIIAKFGYPIAKIVPFLEKKTPIKIGIMKGEVELSSDFDAPLPDEIMDSFYEKDETIS